MSSGRKEELNKYQGAVNPITQGVIWKQLLRYFAPLLAASFLQLLYNTADTVIAGRFVGKIALTAVGGSAGQIYAMVTEFMIGLSGGAGVILSQAYGARSKKLLDDGLHNAVALALALGALFMVTGLIVSGPALRLAGAPEETMAQSVLYLRIVFAGIISNALYNMGAGVLRAVGDSRRPLRFLMISSGLNIALDLLFVAVFRMGIGGAALATILSQTLSAALVLRTLIRGTGRELMPKLALNKLRLQRDVVLKMLRLGVPLGFETLMYTFSCVVLTSAVNTFGTDTVAAYAGFVRIESFYWILEAAFAVSITTFVGQNYGAGQYERCKKALFTCLTEDVIATGLTIGLLVCFGRNLLTLFNDDPKVIHAGMTRMRYLMCAFPFSMCNEILAGFLRGFGISMPPALVSLIGVCGVRILWIIAVFPRLHTFSGLMMVYPVSLGVAALASLVMVLVLSPSKRALKA